MRLNRFSNYKCLLFVILYYCIEARTLKYDRGISLCAGNHIFNDALYIIDQVRTIFNSTLPIALNHCNELSKDHIDKTYGYENIFEWNLCELNTNTTTILNMNKDVAEKRLKSWFCKTAALILSPFNETMVVDLDVIFFKKPDILFDSPAYKRTHSLFFRDRIAYQAKRVRKDEIIYQDIIKEFILKESNMTNITTDEAYQLSISNGHSFFWRNIANESHDALLDFQDSSIILLDSRNHPKTLEVLERLLPSFKLGWGDKEIYWIAATIAQEPFSFEPTLAVFYGDCTSILLHFDPSQENDKIDSVTPFYINGEWVVEKVHAMGDWIEQLVANPTFVNESLHLKTLNNNHKMHCTCPVYGCSTLSREFNLLVLRAQWERLQRPLSREGPEKDCMNIYKPEVTIVEDMVEKYLFSQQKCNQFGCVYLPINVNHTYDWYSPYFCDPVIFDNPKNEIMANLSKRAVIPPPPLEFKEGQLVKGNSRSVYIIRNSSLHEFPNAETFLKMGFEWDQIVNWPQYMFHYIKIEEPLKPIR